MVDMVHIKNQCKIYPYSYAVPVPVPPAYPYSYAYSASPCLNFHHDPLTIFPIKYLGIDEHGGNYN